MFDDERKALKDRPAYRKEQKKLLPYTITEIKDIDVWKAARRAKNEEDERNRKARFNDVVNRLQVAQDSGTEISQTVEIKRMIVEAEKSASVVENSYAGGVASPSKKEARRQIREAQQEPIYTAPWYSRLADKVLNFFTNINFGS